MIGSPGWSGFPTGDWASARYGLPIDRVPPNIYIIGEFAFENEGYLITTQFD